MKEGGEKMIIGLKRNDKEEMKGKAECRCMKT